MDTFDAYCWKLQVAVKASGKSRMELAQLLGVKPATIKSWVVGRRSPTVRRLLELTAVLGIGPATLFEEAADMPEATTCAACGQTFSRRVGFRIHVALRAKDCPDHARLNQPAA